MMLAYALLAGVLCAPQALDVPTILDRVRAAIRYDALAHAENGWVVEGKSQFLGNEVRFRLWFDGTGRFLDTVEGPVSQVSGFDGKTAFEVDASGMPSPLFLGDRERRLYSVWVQTGRWLAPGGPFDISLDRAGTTDEIAMLELHLKDGLLSARVAIDRRTWRPQTSASLLKLRGTRIALEDYREAAGLCWPHQITVTAEDDTPNVTQVSSIRPGTSEDRARCQVPREPEDTDFDAAVAAPLAVERIPSGHLLVPARIDGKDAGTFIFDSGAGGSCIDAGVAKDLGMRRIADLNAVGAGGTEKGAFFQAESLALGAMTIERPRFAGLDLRGIGAAMGRKIAGVCGYEIFRRAVVVVDMTTPSVELYPPGDFVLEGAQWQDLILYSHHPCVPCTFDAGKSGPQSAVFKLDTGAGNDSVTFHAPAVTRWKLLEDRTTTATQRGGVGGSSAAQAGTIGFFELAGHRFERPQVYFSLAGSGAFTDDYTAGNIGGRFMGMFKIAFDYANQRIAFIPREPAK